MKKLDVNDCGFGFLICSSQPYVYMSVVERCWLLQLIPLLHVPVAVCLVNAAVCCCQCTFDDCRLVALMLRQHC